MTVARSDVSIELVNDDGDGVQVGAATVPELVLRFREVLGRDAAMERLTPEGGLRGCLACGHEELYTQRDFPRGLGITIVVVAAVLAPFTKYVSLFVAAVLDAVLYRLAPKMVVCYVCHAFHRGFSETPRHPSFDREIEERLLYGKKAVMGKPMRPGGTADAPEPEH